MLQPGQDGIRIACRRAANNAARLMQPLLAHRGRSWTIGINAPPSRHSTVHWPSHPGCAQRKTKVEPAIRIGERSKDRMVAAHPSHRATDGLRDPPPGRRRHPATTPRAPGQFVRMVRRSPTWRDVHRLRKAPEYGVRHEVLLQDGWGSLADAAIDRLQVLRERGRQTLHCCRRHGHLPATRTNHCPPPRTAPGRPAVRICGVAPLAVRASRAPPRSSQPRLLGSWPIQVSRSTPGASCPTHRSRSQ